LGEIERLRAGAAERALERARGALASGRADRVDVANAEARVLGLQDRWLQRRLDYAALQAQLESAVGAEMR
jgi:outer membrane protein TolC